MLVTSFVFADRVCISTLTRIFKAKRCFCGDYHSVAVMEGGDIYAWYAMKVFEVHAVDQCRLLTIYVFTGDLMTLVSWGWEIQMCMEATSSTRSWL